jgi:hypothetical protein
MIVPRMLDAQYLLQPHHVPHREHILSQLYQDRKYLQSETLLVLLRRKKNQ